MITTALDNFELPGRLNWQADAKRIRHLEPIARRYVFDKDASSRVGEMIRDNLDMMIDNIEFARPPYPTTYIELDAEAMWTAWRPEQTRDWSSDTHLGYFIHEGTVIVLPKSSSHPKSLPAIFGFRMNRPQTISTEAMFQDYKIDVRGWTPEKLSSVTKLAYVFGGQRKWIDDNKVDVWLPAPGNWSLVQVASHFDIFPTVSGLTHRELVNAAFLGGGDPIILMTALLLLQQPAQITVNLTAARRGIFAGKLKSFKEHNVVTIDLAQKAQIVKHLNQTDRASPLLHDVEGHWCNYNKQSGCEHEWEPIGPEQTPDGGFKRYWCPKCLQRRTWTDAYTRGDATRGVATKHYEVVRDNQQ